MYMVVAVLIIVLTLIILHGKTDPVAFLTGKTMLSIVFFLGSHFFFGAELGSLKWDDWSWWQWISVLSLVSQLTFLFGLSVADFNMVFAFGCLSLMGYGFRLKGDSSSSPEKIILAAVVVCGIFILAFQEGAKLNGFIYGCFVVSAISQWVFVYLVKFNRSNPISSLSDQYSESATMEFYFGVGSIPILMILFCWKSYHRSNYWMSSIFVPLLELSSLEKLAMAMIVILEQMKGRLTLVLVESSSTRFFVGVDRLGNFLLLVIGGAIGRQNLSALGILVAVFTALAAIGFVSKDLNSKKTK
jgi:hypothetical protein